MNKDIPVHGDTFVPTLLAWEEFYDGQQGVLFPHVRLFKYTAKWMFPLDFQRPWETFVFLLCHLIRFALYNRCLLYIRTSAALAAVSRHSLLLSAVQRGAGRRWALSLTALWPNETDTRGVEDEHGSFRLSSYVRVSLKYSPYMYKSDSRPERRRTPDELYHPARTLKTRQMFSDV